MKKPKPITLPGLVQEVGGSDLARAIGCNPSLPSKWAKGQRPGWRNIEKLVDFAKARGYALDILGGAR